LVLLTFCVSVGCSNVRTVGAGQVTPEEAQTLVGEYARFHTDDGIKAGTVGEVDYPYVIYRHKTRSYRPRWTGEAVGLRIDLRKVNRVEIVESDMGKNFSLIPGVVIFGVLLMVALVMAFGEIEPR
jgi:hypothetical protein